MGRGPRPRLDDLGVSWSGSLAKLIKTATANGMERAYHSRLQFRKLGETSVVVRDSQAVYLRACKDEQVYALKRDAAARPRSASCINRLETSARSRTPAAEPHSGEGFSLGVVGRAAPQLESRGRPPSGLAALRESIASISLLI
jgi:hypothetical protein